MSKLGIDNWAGLLWEYYLPQIKTGEPFYLAVDKRLMLELARTRNSGFFDENSALDDFNSACEELFEVRRSKIELKQSAFVKRPATSFSRIICLAVQQVIVVENMLSDPKFTENAYFPRYRQLLKLEEADQAMSPLLSEDFQAIWETLKKEILSVAGSTVRSVTFAPGNIKRDLNRQLPISQALFTTHDLQRIYEKIGERDNWDDDGVIRQLLYKIMGYLGTRAQCVISAYDSVTFARLCQQLRSFMKNPSRRSHVRVWRREAGSQDEILAFLDSRDIFDDVFSVHIASKIDQEVSGFELRTAIGRKCDGGRVLILCVAKDRYVEMESGVGLSEGDSIVAIMAPGQEKILSSALAFKGVEWKAAFHSGESNLPEGFQLFRADNLKPGLANHLNALILPDGGTFHEVRLRVTGGLLADGRAHIYLAGYPPEAIEYRGAHLINDEPIVVNTFTSTVGALLGDLSEQSECKNYLIEYKGDSARFIISPVNLLKEEIYKFGYMCNSGKVTPLTVVLGEGVSNLNGLVLTEPISTQNVASVEPLEPRTVAFMLTGEHENIPEEEKAWIVERVKHSRLPSGVGKLLEQRILEGRFTLTPTLRREIQIRKSAKRP